MKKSLILTAFLVIGSCNYAYAQCVDDAVNLCVPRATVDRTAKAMSELIEARDVIAKFTTERASFTAEREAATRLVDRLNSVIAVQDRLNLEREAVMALYKQTIQMYADLTEKLTKQLYAPKSPWQKFLSALKTVATLAAGIALGRGF